MVACFNHVVTVRSAQRVSEPDSNAALRALTGSTDPDTRAVVLTGRSAFLYLRPSDSPLRLSHGLFLAKTIPSSTAPFFFSSLRSSICTQAGDRGGERCCHGLSGASITLAIDARFARRLRPSVSCSNRLGIVPEACFVVVSCALVGLPTALDWLMFGPAGPADDVTGLGLAPELRTMWLARVRSRASTSCAVARRSRSR